MEVTVIVNTTSKAVSVDCKAVSVVSVLPQSTNALLWEKFLEQTCLYSSVKHRIPTRNSSVYMCGTI